jgi:hypothetical protein
MCFVVTGFHNRWNKTVDVRHPNLWVFVRKLKDEEVTVRSRLHAAERGDPAPTRKRRYRLLEDQIKRVQHEYQHEARTVNSYWRAVANAVHHFN